MKRVSSINSLDNLSDVELHQKLLQYGLPNVPVTETTRGLLLNRLKNHIKNEKFKRRQSKDHNSADKVQHLNSNNFSFNNSTPTLLHSTTADNSSFMRSSPRMYAPPPILASDNTENLRRTSYMNVDRLPTYGNGSPNGQHGQMPSTQYGMVGRLLSFRDSTLKKASLGGQGSPNHERRRKMYAPPPVLASDRTLVCAFFIFFIAIALIYAFMSPDHSKTIREIATNSIVCDINTDSNNQNQLAQDCIDKENLPTTLTLNKQLLGFLQERAKQHHCVNKSTPAALNLAEFLSASKGDIENVHRPLVSILRDMEHLIANNPQWKIGITDVNGAPLSLTANNDFNAQKTFFVLFKPSLPFSCVFLNKLTQFFTIVGTGAVILATIILGYALFNYYKRNQQLKAEAIERFVSKIIHELLEASRKGTGEVVVNHLRDTLVPFNERKALLKNWNEALKLIESNDSRIQFAMKTVNGEDVKIIRWVGGGMSEKFNSTDPACAGGNKVTKSKWQSPAFDNRNQIVHPPTPCLKIRHMFDAADVNNPNLKQLIHAAIVEKVGPKCNILDVQLDKQSFCVYVRCATEEDAGLMHNEINGWWFDKRLISIKFLRLERYFSRFPKSQPMLGSC